MMANFGSRSACRGQIVCTIPYIRTEVNIFIVFRALGVIADKDIIERCVSAGTSSDNIHPISQSPT